MELFKKKTPETQVSQDKDSDYSLQAERIRRVLSEHALVRNLPFRGKATMVYESAEVPTGLGIASRVRKDMDEEYRQKE